MKAFVPIAFAFVLIAGCNKPDDVRPKTAATPMKQNSLENPAVPTPPLPKVAADANPVAGPLPGQTNDHSTPAFKEGGVPDRK